MKIPEEGIELVTPCGEDTPDGVPKEVPKEYFHIVTRKNSLGRGFHSNAHQRGRSVGPPRKRGRKKGYRKPPRPPTPLRLGPYLEGGPVPLMVNERERRKTSGRFNAFLEVIKGEKEFYIEGADEVVSPLPITPSTPRRGRRKKEITPLYGGESPHLSVLTGSLLEEEMPDRTCVIHVKEEVQQVQDPHLEDQVGEPPPPPGILGELASEDDGVSAPGGPFSDFRGGLDLHIGEPLFGISDDVTPNDVTDLKTFQISDDVMDMVAMTTVTMETDMRQSHRTDVDSSLGTALDACSSFMDRNRKSFGASDIHYHPEPTKITGYPPVTLLDSGEVPVKKFRCKLCSSTYASFDEASRHAKAFHSFAVCEGTSSSSYFSKESAVGGEGCHSAPSPFGCPECDRQFPTERGRDKHHLLMHLKNSPVSCPDCARPFNSFRPLERHLRIVHDRNPVHPCEVCEDEFVLGTSLEHHLNIVHPPKAKQGSKLYSTGRGPTKRIFHCPICRRRFAGSKAFRMHRQKAHNGEAFACQQCKFKTESASGLKRHLATVHKAIKLSLYVCAVCKGGYQTPQELEEHYVLLHQHEPSNQCPFCGDKFACLEMLRFHKGRHRAFSCDFCPMGFMKQETLEEHLSSIHKNDLAQETEKLFDIYPAPVKDVSQGELSLQSVSEGSLPSPDEDNSKKVLEIKSDGSVEVKELTVASDDENDSSVTQSGEESVPSKVHHLHNTRDGVLREMDSVDPFKGFRLKDLPKKINCPVCNKLLTTKFIRTHIRSHQGSLPHKCPKCPKAYAQGTLLRKHMRNRHYDDFLKMGNKMPKKKKVQCEYCDLIFDDIYILEEHLWQHMDEKNYKCETCRIKFGMKVNWMEHYKTHYFKEEKHCPNCDRSFKSIGYYRDHLERCQSNWTCEDCGLKCESPELYRKHRKIEHGGETKLHQCPHCYKKFHSKYGYDDHLITHSSEKQFSCSVCDKGFKRQRPLNEHMNRVHNKTNQVCAFCGLLFSDIRELQTHLKEHRHLKVTCDECGAVYLSRQALDNHIAVYHNVLLSQDPFVCPHCSEIFTKQADMKVHLPLHFPDTPYVCQVNRCHKMFRREGLLRSHIARRHANLEYICHLCDRKFLLDSDLLKHLANHNEDRVSSDGEAVAGDSLLLQVQLDDKPYECVLCDFKSLHSARAVAHVCESHNSQTGNPLDNISVSRWKCTLCAKLFSSCSSLEKHLEQHALHGTHAEGVEIKVILSEIETGMMSGDPGDPPGETGCPGTSTLTLDDLLPLTKVEVIAQTEDAQTGAPVKLAAHTWHCPSCFFMTSSEDDVRSHLVGSASCLEVLVNLFTSKGETPLAGKSEEEKEPPDGTYPDETYPNEPSLQYVIVNNMPDGTSPAETQDETPFLFVDNQLQLVMNTDGNTTISDLLSGATGEAPDLTLLQMPDQKNDSESKETFGDPNTPFGGDNSDLLGGTTGVILQMEDGKLVIPEMGARGAQYHLVKEETNLQGTTESTYEILQDPQHFQK